jgi:hypothetical protein
MEKYMIRARFHRWLHDRFASCRQLDSIETTPADILKKLEGGVYVELFEHQTAV